MYKYTLQIHKTPILTPRVVYDWLFRKERQLNWAFLQSWNQEEKMEKSRDGAQLFFFQLYMTKDIRKRGWDMQNHAWQMIES